MCYIQLGAWRCAPASKRIKTPSFPSRNRTHPGSWTSRAGHCHPACATTPPTAHCCCLMRRRTGCVGTAMCVCVCARMWLCASAAYRPTREARCVCVEVVLCGGMHARVHVWARVCMGGVSHMCTCTMSVAVLPLGPVHAQIVLKFRAGLFCVPMQVAHYIDAYENRGKALGSFFTFQVASGRGFRRPPAA